MYELLAISDIGTIVFRQTADTERISVGRYVTGSALFFDEQVLSDSFIGQFTMITSEVTREIRR